MKKLMNYTVLVLVILLWAKPSALAQQKITEGCLTISYVVDSLKMRNVSEVQEKLSIFFKDGYLKTVRNIGTPKLSLETSYIRQLGQPKVLILTETAGLKVAMIATEQEMEELLSPAYVQKKGEPTKIELLNAMIELFKATGQFEQIEGRKAEKYSAQTGSELPLHIWATTEVELPFDLIKYETGTLGQLLKNKKIKGTLCRLIYGNKLEVNIHLDTQPVTPISMAVPTGYQTFNLSEIMANKTKAKN